jgi:IS30 family transposase
MKKYKQLTLGKRYQIYGLKQAGLNQTRIAQKIGVDKSTISREFRRNKGQRGWRPKQAQSFSDERRQALTNGKCRCITYFIENQKQDSRVIRY